MEIFNGDVSIWHKYAGINNEFDARFNIEDKCKLEVKSRIGSESTMAQVFKVETDKIEIAAKILPITNNSSVKNNENEILLAIEASELVKVRKSKYFLRVYGFAFCKETYFYEDKYYEKSRRFQEYEYLLTLTNDSNIIEKIKDYKKRFIDADITAKKIFPDLDIKFSGKVQSHILFSELAYCDLKYYIETYEPSVKDIKIIVKNIFKAIRDMHMKLHIVHNDLHLGNILIKSLDNPIPLIHDFGKSYKSEFISEYDRKDDLLHFLNKLTMYNFVDELIEFVIDCEDKYIVKSLLENYL
jgi:hypothetical protein